MRPARVASGRPGGARGCPRWSAVRKRRHPVSTPDASPPYRMGRGGASRSRQPVRAARPGACAPAFLKMTRYDETRMRLRAQPRTWVVTGAAGFIGSNLAEHLLALGQRVVGL